MTREPSLPPQADKLALASPVGQIMLVDELVRQQKATFQSRSLPGHLLHIVAAGEVCQWAEGRAEAFGKGNVVWYYEDEPIHGEIRRAPWRFITINFHAPAIAPPPDDQRVLSATPKVMRHARKLLRLWRDHSLPPLQRQLRCHRELLTILDCIIPHAKVDHALAPQAKLWWRIERHLRARLDKRIDLAGLEELSGASQRTVIRACHAATGLPPMKRLQELRLSYAAGLVQHSDLTMTEIAFRLGYARSQEFSRDYHRRYGVAPREDRRRPPSYRNLESPPADLD